MTKLNRVGAGINEYKSLFFGGFFLKFYVMSYVIKFLPRFQIYITFIKDIVKKIRQVIKIRHILLTYAIYKQLILICRFHKHDSYGY